MLVRCRVSIVTSTILVQMFRQAPLAERHVMGDVESVNDHSVFGTERIHVLFHLHDLGLVHALEIGIAHFKIGVDFESR